MPVSWNGSNYINAYVSTEIYFRNEGGYSIISFKSTVSTTIL